MAYKKGGIDGLRKAISSNSISTIQYENGIQISGVFTELVSKNNDLVYIKTNGPTALSYLNKELKNHSTKNHPEGFGAPIGKIKNFNISSLSIDVLRKGSYVTFEYESGLLLSGKVVDFVLNNDKILIVTFMDCEIKYYDQILYDKSWGIYDLICAENIISCFPKAADKKSFPPKTYMYKSETIKVNYSQKKKIFIVYIKR